MGRRACQPLACSEQRSFMREMAADWLLAGVKAHFLFEQESVCEALKISVSEGINLFLYGPVLVVMSLVSMKRLVFASVQRLIQSLERTQETRYFTDVCERVPCDLQQPVHPVVCVAPTVNSH